MKKKKINVKKRKRDIDFLPKNNKRRRVSFAIQKEVIEYSPNSTLPQNKINLAKKPNRTSLSSKSLQLEPKKQKEDNVETVRRFSNITGNDMRLTVAQDNEILMESQKTQEETTQDEMEMEVEFDSNINESNERKSLKRKSSFSFDDLSKEINIGSDFLEKIKEQDASGEKEPNESNRKSSAGSLIFDDLSDELDFGEEAIASLKNGNNEDNEDDVVFEQSEKNQEAEKEEKKAKKNKRKFSVIFGSPGLQRETEELENEDETEDFSRNRKSDMRLTIAQDNHLNLPEKENDTEEAFDQVEIEIGGPRMVTPTKKQRDEEFLPENAENSFFENWTNKVLLSTEKSKKSKINIYQKQLTDSQKKKKKKKNLQLTNCPNLLQEYDNNDLSFVSERGLRTPTVKARFMTPLHTPRAQTISFLGRKTPLSVQNSCSKIVSKILGKSPQLKKIIAQKNSRFSFPLTNEMMPELRNLDLPNKISIEEFYKKANVSFVDGMLLMKSNTELKNQKYDANNKNISKIEELNGKTLYSSDFEMYKTAAMQLKQKLDQIRSQNNELIKKYNEKNPRSFQIIQNLSEAGAKSFTGRLIDIKKIETFKAQIHLRQEKNKMLEDMIKKRQELLAIQKTENKKLEDEIEEKKKIIVPLEKEIKNKKDNFKKKMQEINESIIEIKTADQEKEKTKKKTKKIYHLFKQFVDCDLKFISRDHFYLIFRLIGRKLELDLSTNNIIRAKLSKIRSSFFDGNEKIRALLIDLCRFDEKIEEINNSYDNLKEVLIYFHHKISKIRTINDILHNQIYKKRGIMFEVNPLFNKSSIADGKTEAIPIEFTFITHQNGTTTNSLSQFSIPHVYIKLTFAFSLDYPKCNFNQFKFSKIIGNIEKRQIENIVNGVEKTSFFRFEKIIDEVINLTKSQ